MQSWQKPHVKGATTCFSSAVLFWTKGKRAFIGFFLLMLCLSFSPAQLHAADNTDFQREADYLINLAGKNWLEFSPAQISNLLDALQMQSAEKHDFKVPKFGRSKGLYFEFTIPMPMGQVLRYCYDPNIPGVLLRPNSLRTQAWTPDSVLANLVSVIEGPATDTPKVFVSRELQQSTPATSTGTYYSFSEDRFMARFQYNGSDVVLSVSNMPAESSAGMKGAIVGPDSDWLYFYSDEVGLTWGGPSSVETHIYESASIQFIFEPRPGLTKFATFKWMRAGWKGINFVNDANLREGCDRFIAGMLQVLTSPKLPSVETLTAKAREVEAWSEAQLKEALQPLVKTLQTAALTDPHLERKSFQELLAGENYLNSFTKEEMRAEILKMYLHQQLQP